jgi:hypothetical protein
VWARPPLEAEQKNLEHRVEFATVNLQLTEEYKAQLTPPAPSISTPDSQRSGRGLPQCVGKHPRLCFVSCRIRAYAADPGIWKCGGGTPRAARGACAAVDTPKCRRSSGPFNISLTSVSLPLLRRVLHSWLAARQAVAEYWRGKHEFSVQLRYCSRG